MKKKTSRFIFQEKAFSRTIFHDFELFYDFLEGFCKNSVLIFTLHIISVLNFAHFQPSARNCAKISTNKVDCKNHKTFGRALENHKHEARLLKRSAVH